ncbi:hypothetical protein GYMLUDRAFT_58892 [Collybiopsis luxurians FD-317 M1]|uniref:Uncharacterized protein n=1 Tax=Collybiopsis luxurians FD-317 M1 TaxID=944289 RepID=A0A0D0CFJ0_9AGAR|nr:hypothetical protein GYMLUDRAFT_58892 [Collybiopsis luxurians FD-317 M1]
MAAKRKRGRITNEATPSPSSAGKLPATNSLQGRLRALSLPVHQLNHPNLRTSQASVKLYEETIKRDSSNPRGYNNRAIPYIKLAAFLEAPKDVNKVIEVDLSFVKPYIRKENIPLSMSEA